MKNLRFNKDMVFGLLLGLLLGALVLSLKFVLKTPEAGMTTNSSLITVEIETGSGLPETL